MIQVQPAFYDEAWREWWIAKTKKGFTIICKHILKNLLQNWNLLTSQTTSKQEASHVNTDLRFPVPVSADICLYAVHRRALVYLLTRGVPHLKLNLQFSLREGQRSRLQMFSYGVSLEVRIVERGGGRIKGCLPVQVGVYFWPAAPSPSNALNWGLHSIDTPIYKYL